jgi:hypothetical protein
VVGSHPADSDEVTIAVPSGTPELKRGDGIGIGADRYVVLADAILDADGVEVRIAPPLIAALADGDAVSHFPAKPAEIAVKPGLNLYTKLAVDGLPKLESWLNGLDVKERYLKLTGYLSAEVSLVLSAESQEKNQPIEIVGDMALIATIPLPVLSPLLRRVVTGRELSLEIGFKVEYQPTFKPKPATTSNTTAASPPAPPAAPSPPQKGGAEDQAPVSPGMSDKEQPEIVEGPGEKPTETPAEKKDDGDAPEGKFRVQLKDEWTIPLPVFDLSAPAPKTEDVTFSQAYQVEIGGGETEWSAEYGSDYKWDLLAFAVHDLAFSFSATKKKPDGATPGAAKETEKKGKLAAEFDIGRAEKIGELELEFEAPDDAAKKRKAWAKWEATLKLKPDAALALGPAIRDVILPIWSAVLKP